MANQIIIDELQTPGVFGLNNFSNTYTNPGGVLKDDAIDAIVSNAALFNTKSVERYVQYLDPPSLFWRVFTDGSRLESLSAPEEKLFANSVAIMMQNGPIERPDLLLKDLINNRIFSNPQDSSIRDAYEALIRETVTVAEQLDIFVNESEVEQAMFALGWII